MIYVLSYEMKGTGDVSSSLISNYIMIAGQGDLALFYQLLYFYQSVVMCEMKLICNHYITIVIFSYKCI